MYISDNIFDNGLQYITANAARMDICSDDPGITFSNVALYTVGYSEVTAGSPEDGAVDGRMVTIPTIPDGLITGTDLATHWVLTDSSSEILASGLLTTPLASQINALFTLEAITITLRNPS